MRAGLIPSRALQERRIVHERNELNGDTTNLTSDKVEGNILEIVELGFTEWIESKQPGFSELFPVTPLAIHFMRISIFIMVNNLTIMNYVCLAIKFTKFKFNCI